MVGVLNIIVIVEHFQKLIHLLDIQKTLINQWFQRFFTSIFSSSVMTFNSKYIEHISSLKLYKNHH